MAKGKKKGGILDFVENYTGDKVIWMVVLLLMMFSILSVFSSTSLLAQQKHESRVSIVKVQCLVVLAGLAIMLFFASKAATAGGWKLTKKIILGIKTLFIGKEKI